MQENMDSGHGTATLSRKSSALRC